MLMTTVVVLLCQGAPGAAELDRRAGEFERLRVLSRAAGSVRVLVRLDVPRLEALSRASRAGGDRQRTGEADRALAAAVAGAGARLRDSLAATPYAVTRTFRTVPFMAIRASEQALRFLEASPLVIDVAEDRLGRPTLDGTVPLVGAADAWAASGTGSGWYVAVLDTGVQADHDFFAGKSILQACFASGVDGDPQNGGDCPNGESTDTVSFDAARHHPSHFNFYDHGTQVTGVAVGNDPDPQNVPRYGVAPGAGLIAVQVYSRFEDHPACGAAVDCVLSYTSDQVAGLEYVYSLRVSRRIAAVNLSIGSGRYFDQASCDGDFAAMEAVVANLRAVGIATVMGAGNDGYCDSLSGPGCLSSAVAVGATDDLDVEASFSNYHPGMLELFAPGVSILTSTGTGTGDYVSRSGTSLSAPHVAGAWALLRQARPGASVDEILAVLVGSGVTPVASRCGGAAQPRIRVDAAVALLGTPVPTLTIPAAVLLGVLLLLGALRILRSSPCAR
jgi:subtilisin family serine protease